MIWRHTVIEVQQLTKRYGPFTAVDGVSFNVGKGEILGFLGPNGAGKTTTMRTISGLRTVIGGSIKFEGKDITNMASHDRVKLGICQSPEGRGIFPGMTVRENLEMGTYVRTDAKSAAKHEDMERVMHLFPRLRERISQFGGTLSGGEQQMLAIGRALMARPRLLLLDEPSMGLAPKLIAQIFSIITEINQQGTTVLLVEQNAAQALKRAHRAYVLETGNVVKSGAGIELLDDPAVRAAYLGGH